MSVREDFVNSILNCDCSGGHVTFDFLGLLDSEALGVCDVSLGFPYAAFGVAVAGAGVEARAVQLTEATVVPPLQGIGSPARYYQVVQAVAGQAGRPRFFANQRKDQGVGSPLGGAPSLFRRIAHVTGLKSFYGLDVHLASVGKDFVNLVLDCGSSHRSVPEPCVEAAGRRVD